MARAKRLYVPVQIWHITHRCHKQEFQLKFDRIWVQAAFKKTVAKREHRWTESIAVGSSPFIERIKPPWRRWPGVAPTKPPQEQSNYGKHNPPIILF